MDSTDNLNQSWVSKAMGYLQMSRWIETDGSENCILDGRDRSIITPPISISNLKHSCRHFLYSIMFVVSQSYALSSVKRCYFSYTRPRKPQLGPEAQAKFLQYHQQGTIFSSRLHQRASFNAAPLHTLDTCASPVSSKKWLRFEKGAVVY